MAALCAALEQEEVPGRGQALRCGGSKRNFADYSPPALGNTDEPCKREEDFSHGVSQKKANLEFYPLPLGHQTSFERTIPYDVSALRQAAAAAVAEYNGPLGPSIQLTEPDNAHEVTASDQRFQSMLSNPREKSPSRGPTGELQEKDKGSNASQALPPRLSDLSSLSNPQPGGLGNVFTQRGCPPYGAKAICGRRPRMEDAFTAVPFLLEVPVPATKLDESEIVPARIAPQLKADSSPKADSASTGTDFAPVAGPSEGAASALQDDDAVVPEVHGDLGESYLETLHFFGVFDGHGGAEAALHCAQTLHQRIAEALAAKIDPDINEEVLAEGPSSSASHETELQPQNLVPLPSGLPALLPSVDEEEQEPSSSEELVDEALKSETQEGDGANDGIACTSASFESALTSAFNRTDEEFGKADNAALVGTTAVVALVGSRQLYVANCGDSRAVLCRNGQAIPLTDDHKAAREDETARVEAAGGHILYWNGVRVMGVLAVSRAIGDHCLRPFVIAQPEVTILVRRPDDEILLMASDGLWDVLNNQEACTLAKRCLRRARQRGASRQSAARIAATVLTRAAVDRGSRDNVTVLVVDLSMGATDVDDMSRTQSAAIPE